MTDLQTRFGRWQQRSLIVGVVCVLLAVVGGFFNTQQFFVSYLFSYLFWLGLAAGCFIVAMIHYLTGGRWGHSTRRFFEAGFGTLPFWSVLFIPILFGLKLLYPWAKSGQLPDLLQKKQPYLGTPFFIVRVVVILGIWTFLAVRLRRWSLAQDETLDPTPTYKLARLSGPGLVIVPLTATVAYIDWIMSLEARWYSTVFAIVVLAGQVLSAYAFSVVLLRRFGDALPLARLVSRKTYHQLGNLLLTFVMFWTYVAFGQLLIIYSGNLPDEIAWYRHRIAGGWLYLLAIIACFHFFVPFFLLLFRTVKRHSGSLAILALMLLVVHLLDSYWMIGPSIFQDGIHFSWLNIVVPIGLGGIWLAAFFWLLQRAPVVPLNDPRIQAEIAEEGPA